MEMVLERMVPWAAGYAHAGKEFFEILALHEGASLVRVMEMKNRGMDRNNLFDHDFSWEKCIPMLTGCQGK